jgi:uncharacterized coiled-coil DUF342 family protein
VTYKDFLKTKYDEVNADIERRNKMKDQRDAIEKQLGELQEQKRELQSIIHRDFKKSSPEEIKKAISDFEKKYETTSLTKDQEKKLL